jgi:hypothetical protein
MGIKEFSLKTGAFIVLPMLLIYGCLRERESSALNDAAQRACMKALCGPATKAVTIVQWVSDTNSSAGHRIRIQILDTTALRRLRMLASEMHPVRLGPSGYRASQLNYQLVVSNGRDTCELGLHRTYLGVDLLEAAGDSAYEAPKLMPFIDSLFRGQQSINRRGD